MPRANLSFKFVPSSLDVAVAVFHLLFLLSLKKKKSFLWGFWRE